MSVPFNPKSDTFVKAPQAINRKLQAPCRTVDCTIQRHSLARAIQCAINAVDKGAKVDTLQALTYHQVYFPAESFL